MKYVFLSRRKIIVIIFIFLSFIFVGYSQKTINKNESSKTQKFKITTLTKSNMKFDDFFDSDYVRALRGLDEFLNVWAHRDWLTGPNYMTDSLKKELGEDELRETLCGISNPHHMSYEIFGGSRINKDTFRFNVMQYEDIASETYGPDKRANPSFIEVKRCKDKNGYETWLINKL